MACWSMLQNTWGRNNGSMRVFAPAATQVIDLTLLASVVHVSIFFGPCVLPKGTNASILGEQMLLVYTFDIQNSKGLLDVLASHL